MRVLAAVLFVLLLLLAYTAVRVVGLNSDLQVARAKLNAAAAVGQSAGFAISPADAARIDADLSEADAALQRAADTLTGDPMIAVARFLPVAGTQVSAVDTMVSAARRITSRHDEARLVVTGFIAARDSPAGTSRLAAFARFAAQQGKAIDDLLGNFQQADREVSQLSASGLLGPVAGARALLADRFDQTRAAVSAGRQAAAIMPSMLGVGGHKRYLVFALDNAEVRPIGGLIAAFAVPTFADGVLQDATFRDIQSIDRPDQKAYVPPPGPLSDHLLGAFTWQVADAGWWPDFAKSVQAARDMYKLETGDSDIQGAIAFTPEFVDRLLTVVGPVEVREAGVTVHTGETYLLSLEQTEVINRGEGRKAFLANLASQVISRLFALPPSRYPDVVKALAEAGARKQLQMVFDDPATQAGVAALGWSGSFTFPEKSDRLAIIEANVAPVSKLDVLLTLDHSLDVAILADGSATERLVTTYTNHFGPKLPPELERVRSTFFAGNLGSYNRRYLDPNADVIGVSSDDAQLPITDPDSVEPESGCLAVGNYQFVRPGTVHLTTDYSVPNVVDRAVAGSGKGHFYRLFFRKQPGRDHDTLVIRITPPDGMKPISWAEGGVLEGRTVTFSVTTEFDHAFYLEFGTS